ncbi:MAG TPA: ComEC/Rec2 family competence protein [Thermoleophilaceae bacterium]|nr:ComEC/Rec2 family competence protein [Thermoleophilaceae bacterium]
MCGAPAEALALGAALLIAAGAGLRAEGLAVALAAALVAGAAFGSLRLAAVDRAGERLAEGARIEGRAHLLERPRRSAFGSRAAVELIAGSGAGMRLQARSHQYLRWPAGADPGWELRVRGRFASVAAVSRRPRGTGGFDAGAYLRSRGLAGELQLDAVAASGRSRGGLAGAVDSMRGRAERAIGRGFSPSEAALLRGMVLGQDEAIDEDVRDSFRASGLAHLLAVSGQNVALLCALALPLVAALGAGSGVRVAALLGLIAVYVPLAGAGPSLQRAGVMGAAALVAMAASRPASRVYALLLAAAATLALNPRATGDVGWQLSLAAVAGIIVLAPQLRRRLGRLPRPLAEGVAVTVAATLATAPLVAHHFGSFSAVSLPANVLALPVVPVIMWAGMLATAAGQLAVLGPPFDVLGNGAAAVLGQLAAPLLGFLANLAERFAELPGAQLPLPLGSRAAVAAAYLLSALGVWAARGAARSFERSLGRRLGARCAAAEALWGSLSRGTRRALLGLLGAAAILLGVVGLGRDPPPDEPTVSFLDVGQGDATLIQAPDGSAVLFDGGPPEGGVVRRLRRAGVRRLSLVVATHHSRDHHGGLPAVLSELPVDLFLNGGDGTDDPAFRALERTAARRRIRSIPARAGLVLRAGSIAVRVLSPPPRPPGPPPEDPNPRAVVALVEVSGMRLFLSADAESEALLPLDLPAVDAMKVPHHGSADPGLPQVLRRLRPRVASIPVGENTYGHPTSSTLRSLRAAGVRTFRNDRDGTVKVGLHGGRLDAASER